MRAITLKDTMVEVKTIEGLQRSTIECSSLQRITDTVRALLHLSPPQPHGFIPDRLATRVDTIIEAETSGIGPIFISTAPERLLSYAVRYDDQQTALMLITGRSISEAMRRGDIARGLESVHRATLLHGPIIGHSMISFSTPTLHSTIEQSALNHSERTQMHRLIMEQTPWDGTSLPHLHVRKLVFTGWSPYPEVAPTCIFESHAGGTFWLTISWGKRVADQYMYKLV